MEFAKKFSDIVVDFDEVQMDAMSYQGRCLEKEQAGRNTLIKILHLDGNDKDVPRLENGLHIDWDEGGTW